MHEISVSGIRVYINKADPVQLRRLLKEDVVMLVYVGEVEETSIDEPDGFSALIGEAQECSDMDDIWKFFDMTGGAAVVCVKEFFLKKCQLLMKSDSGENELLEAICSGLMNEEDAAKVKSTWSEVGWVHSYKYESEHLPKDRREKLLDSLKDMREIVEQADISMVEKKLDNLESSKSLKVCKIDEQECKIGEKMYKYTRIFY